MPSGNPRNVGQPRAKKRKRSDQNPQVSQPTDNTNITQNPSWSSVPPVFDLTSAPDSNIHVTNQYEGPTSYMYTTATPCAGPQPWSVFSALPRTTYSYYS
jgi:hypothetical protein